MNKHKPMQRWVALLLSLVMMFSLATPAAAAGQSAETSKTEASATLVTNRIANAAKAPVSKTAATEEADPDEEVRVSIVLEKASTITAGYSTVNIAKNASAMTYRESLRTQQASVQSKIEQKLGKELDVKWNLTLAANIISANVRRGDIEAIASVAGVKEVVEETQYSPAKVSVGGTLQPNMAVSSEMTGATAAWNLGVTGKGSLIAIIDTGLDTEHISFDEKAFLESIGNDTSVLKLTKDKLTDDILEQLNAKGTADDLYRTAKIAFGYNYVDNGLRIDHKDAQGEHGSHVAGIATANKLIEKDGKYVDAIGAVGVAGNAPDAQIMVMKVFGSGGGAYDSDYFAAVEDAIVLGADSANLSLGSTNAGMTNSTYNSILETLTANGTLMVTSAGNNSSWGENSSVRNLYKDDVNYATGGSPGSFPNTMSVASVDNDGFVGTPIAVDGTEYGYTQSSYTNKPIDTLDTTSDGTGTVYDVVFIDGVGTDAQFNALKDVVSGKIALCRRGETSFYEKAEAAVAAGAVATIIVNNQPGTISMDLSAYTKTQPVISITQDVGNAIWEAYKATETTASGIKYVTGKMTVYSSQKPVMYNSTYKTMSSFSSWGTTGNLAIKPEITAPGGNIYSVYGANNDTGLTAHDQFELMSGTSMAAPQISGITALVQQRLRKDGIKNEGGTYYNLTNALLLSTATPLKYAEGKYYPILRQGAGLANVEAAVTTPAYITVAGRTDGKSKVELGDDYNRTGEYTFKFDLNNLTATAQEYTLSADLFTQEISGDYMTTGTQALQGTVTFSPATVTVPASGKTTVTATIKLDAAAAKALDEQKDGTGFYVEAYVFAKGKSTTEGVEVPTLSVPVLGYYGSWTDPSMFDNDGDYFGKLPTLTNNGTTITGISYAPIRNAGARAVVVRYTLDGEKVTEIITQQTGSYYAAYYSSSAGSWNGTSATMSTSWDSTKVPEGAEDVTICMVLVPEYYAVNGTYNIAALTDGNPANGELGKGAYLPFEVAIDVEPPVVENLRWEKDSEGHYHVKATVSDNTSVVDVALLMSDGETLVRELNPAIYGGSISGDPNFTATAPGQKVEVDFDGFYGLYSFFGIIYYDEFEDYLTPDVYYISLLDASGNETVERILVDLEETEYATGITLSATEAEILKGSTYQLTAKVEPATVKDASVTWTSSNEAVATVDANGVVTAKSVGEATITATANAKTEAGETLSASCTVSVTTMNLLLTGVLADENGDPKNFTWDFAGAGLVFGDDIAQYPSAVANVDKESYYLFNTANNMYLFDKATGQPKDGPWTWDASSPIPWSMSYTNGSYSGYGLNWTYGYYIMVEDNPEDPTYMGFNFSSLGNPFFYAIGGIEEPWTYDLNGELYSGNYTLYAIDDANRVWELMMFQTEQGMSTLRGYSSSDLPITVTGYGEVGDDFQSYSNLLVGPDRTLYYSAMTGDTNELYMLVYNEATDLWESTKLGDVGAEVWPALLLTVEEKASEVKYDFNNDGAVTSKDAQILLDHVVKGTAINYHEEDADVNEDGAINTRDVYELLNKISNGAATLSTSASKSMVKVDAQSLTAKELASVSKTAKTGSLNSVDVDNTAVNPETHTVKVPLYADASTNGMLTVTYNTDQLTFTGLTKGDVQLISTSNRFGEVTIGYANSEEMKDTLIAELSFTYVATIRDQVADITIEVTEEGNEAGIIKTPEQPVIPTIILPAEITPNKPGEKLFGILMDEDSNTVFYSWNTTTGEITYDYAVNNVFVPTAAARRDDNSYYALDAYYNLLKMDMNSDTVLSSVEAWGNEDGWLPFDFAYNTADNSIWMTNGAYVLSGISPDEPVPDSVSGWNLQSYGYPYFYGFDIVNEHWTSTDNNGNHEGDYYIVALGDMGEVFQLMPYATDGGMSATIIRTPYDDAFADAIGSYFMTFDVPAYSSLLVKDGVLYFSLVNVSTAASDLYRLDLINGEYVSTKLGSTAENVYPAYLLGFAPSTLPYDFDGNGVVNEADAQLLLDHVIKGTEIVNCVEDMDVDGDGSVDTYDVHILLNWLANDKIITTIEVTGDVINSEPVTLASIERNTDKVAQSNMTRGVKADEAPEVEEPVADEPVVDAPVVDEPVEDEPVVDEPIEDEPVVEEPVEDEPVEDEPIVDDEPEEPVADEGNKFTGTLNNIDAGSAGVIVDYKAHTVTVPVTASASTNGEFTLTYDPEVLTLISTDIGEVLNSYVITEGAIHFGYADKDQVNEVVLNLVFSFAEDATGTATVELNVKQDGTEVDLGTTEYTFSLTRPIVPGVALAEGESGIWAPGDKDGISFYVNVSGDKILSVMVDGKVVTYTLNANGTIVLSSDFLSTLSAGYHKLTVNFTDGSSAAVEFYISRPGSGSLPQTGDSFNMTLLVVLAMVSMLGMGAVVSTRKRYE